MILLRYNNVNHFLHPNQCSFKLEQNTMNQAYEKHVGQNIRRYREAQKLTQEQVAAKLQHAGCDITRSALAKIEVGQRHIYLDELRLLRMILNVSYDDLLELPNQ